MPRLFLLLLLAVWFVAPGSRAADSAAQAFVEGIYKQYRNATTQGVDLGSDEAVKRYFEPSLAALLIKDAQEAEKKGEVPKLDGDPFIDAQDWQVTDLRIALADTARDRILATVSFNNFKQPKTVKLDLVKVGGAWKIYDITWQHGTLRKLLATP